MKKAISLVLTLAVVIGLFMIPTAANAADHSYNLVFGKTYNGTVDEPLTLYGMTMTNYSDTYTFAMDTSSNVKIVFTSYSQSLQHWAIRSTDYKYSTGTQNAGTYEWYLHKDYTYTVTITGAGKYSLMLDKADGDKLSLKKKSGKLGESKKTVPFTFTGTEAYARENLTVKSSNKKVAEVSHEFTSANGGTFTITPKHTGKATITLKMKGGNTVKYTAYVTKGYWFIAKGSKAKAPTPYGVKNPKWTSSKKKVATINKKTGKINAKAGGRVTFTAKKGKTSYKLTAVVTDYIKLGKKAYKELKSIVNNPELLKIYNVYTGYSKQIYSGQKVPLVMIDYGSTNENGAMVRNKIIAYYDDVYEPRYRQNWSVDNIIGRKSLSPSKIK